MNASESVITSCSASASAGSLCLDWAAAVRNTSENKFASRFPSKDDARLQGILKPIIRPSFSIGKSEKVFTIGSCFAREIEDKLVDFDLPSRAFSAPQSEWPYRPNGLLNEYNPGTISQRILFALNDETYPDSVLVPMGEFAVDLSLPGGAPVTTVRAVERREQIREIYRSLASADIIIITLGLIEAWYDKVSQLYLNRMPPLNALRTYRDRYELRVLDLATSFGLLTEAFSALRHHAKKVLLTVSPVPLQTTFTGVDATIANSLSKSTLRLCAGMLAREHSNVDYFPSYEMATHLGPKAFAPDNVHVIPAVVDQITSYMMEHYLVS